MGRNENCQSLHGMDETAEIDPSRFRIEECPGPTGKKGLAGEVQVRELTGQRIIDSRRALPVDRAQVGKQEAEGGCGVVGLACNAPLEGKYLLQSLVQMRNRGNGKGGGIAAVGLVPEQLGVSKKVLEEDYILQVAYLDKSVRMKVEDEHVRPFFVVDYEARVEAVDDYRSIPGLDVEPPEVYRYFVKIRKNVLAEFARKNGLEGLKEGEVGDEFLYQNSYRLNQRYYSSLGEKKAFVVSHGKNMVVLKLVGYGDDVVRYYRLEDFKAHVWFGHHRYPTKGRVWHPGGAHPFVGLHEALVHNGDFANYTSLCSWLGQRNVHPLFLTDTEVAALAFDLLHRVYGYPLEYVIEALAPTTERDFAMLPPAKQRVFRMLRAVHAHGSPDGPWFFLVAQSDPRSRALRLIGITDTSMLRPQVFAVQRGEVSVGLAASEKQAVDAVLESLASADDRFWSRADLYWSARGGSHTDGGAFAFTVHRGGPAGAGLVVTDKFGRRIDVDPSKHAPSARVATPRGDDELRLLDVGDPPEKIFLQVAARLPVLGYARLPGLLGALVRAAIDDTGRERALAVITLLMDRRVPTGPLKRSAILALLD